MASASNSFRARRGEYFRRHLVISVKTACCGNFFRVIPMRWVHAAFDACAPSSECLQTTRNLPAHDLFANGFEATSDDFSLDFSAGVKDVDLASIVGVGPIEPLISMVVRRPVIKLMD